MLLSARWKYLRPHAVQNRLCLSRARFKIVLAGRGSGKTEHAKRRLVMEAIANPNGLYFYTAPTLEQARNIAWRDVLDLLPPELIANKWENICKILLKNGTEIRFISGENPARFEGVQWNGGIIDEASDQNLHQLVFLSLMPALSHKRAWLWIIGVPKRKGIGAQTFKELCIKASSPEHPDYEYFFWKSIEIAPPEEIELARETLSPADFREQYEASWENAGGLVFPDWSEENVRPCPYRRDDPIIVGSDFNVNPMAWTLSHLVGGNLECFDELFIRDTITPKTLDVLHLRYPTHKAGWIFMGDATSTHRHSSATVTDYVHIHNDERFTPKKMLYPEKNPIVADRIAVMNAAILNAKGVRKVFVDPKCKYLINDFTYMAYDDKNEPLKVGDLSHATDAHGYVIWQALPMRVIKKSTSMVITA
jgi:hypothetical protein